MSSFSSMSSALEPQTPACLYPILHGAPSGGRGLFATRRVLRPSRQSGHPDRDHASHLSLFPQVVDVPGHPELRWNMRTQFADRLGSMVGITSTFRLKVGHSAIIRASWGSGSHLPWSPESTLSQDRNGPTGAGKHRARRSCNPSPRRSRGGLRKPAGSPEAAPAAPAAPAA